MNVGAGVGEGKGGSAGLGADSRFRFRDRICRFTWFLKVRNLPTYTSKETVWTHGSFAGFSAC